MRPADPIEEEWFVWQPMTPNSVPIIDRSPTMDNVPIAAGHNMLRVSMSPATGKLVAELLSRDAACGRRLFLLVAIWRSQAIIGRVRR